MPVSVGIVESGWYFSFVHGGTECGNYGSVVRGKIIAWLDVYGCWRYFGQNEEIEEVREFAFICRSVGGCACREKGVILGVDK